MTICLHWNIHMWYDEQWVPNLERVAAFIGETNPDLVSLTEVEETYAENRLAVMADRLGYAFVFVPCFEDMNEGKRGRFGNAVLSKLPILGVEHKFLTPVDLVYDGGREQTEPRSVTWVKVAGPRPFWFGTTHLPRALETARLEALKLLAATLPQEDPYVLAGDFNTDLTVHRALFGEASLLPAPVMPSYPVSQPTEAIDFFVVSGLAPVWARLYNDTSSDHFPVVLEIAAMR